MKPQKGRNLTKWSGRTVCQLYRTTVCVIDDLGNGKVSIMLNDGGWPTRSTTKAMSAALERHGLQGCVTRKGSVYTVWINGTAHQYDRTLVV